MANKPRGFCFITPIEYMDFGKASNTHLILAHIADVNEQYCEFYRQRSEEGDWIILDNGAFELGVPFTPDKLVEIGIKTGAKCIVLPDYPGKPCSETILAAENLVDEFVTNGFQTMFVPQSEVGDKEDWIEGYKWASTNGNIDVIGMSILGIPNALPHIPRAYARVVMSEILKDRGIFNHDKHHHYLGLNSGPALEIPPLLKMGCLDTVDSSGPVWSAINGIDYTDICDSYMMVSKDELPEVDFDYKYNDDHYELIWNNIQLTRGLFNDK